jgi:hypothetical protein
MNATITPLTIVVPLGTYKDATVTVSDPCYLDADYTGPLAYGNCHDAAVNEKPLADGAWEAYAVKSDLGNGWGERVWYAGVRLADRTDGDTVTDAEQGVDAGMVGFFVNRPALTYDQCWRQEGPWPQVLPIHQDGAAALITGSGLGDGVYDVRITWLDGKIVAVEADYLTCYLGGDAEDE